MELNSTFPSPPGKTDGGASPDVIFVSPGVGRAAELGQPRAGHRGGAQRAPPQHTGAAARQPGGAKPHSPDAAGRARAGAAAVPEAQGEAERCSSVRRRRG